MTAVSAEKLTLPEAIARMEGFYVAGTRPQRNNNPGDIEYGAFAEAHGATGTDGRFAIFPSAEAGFACLSALLAGPAYASLTIAEAIAKYAPSLENDTQRYIADVCEWTGLLASSLVSAALAA